MVMETERVRGRGRGGGRGGGGSTYAESTVPFLPHA